MSKLIKLALYKRAGKLTSGTYGFEVSDIIVPIRNNGSKSYFTSRMIKGSASGTGENNGRVDYEVNDSLINIAFQSNEIIKLTVKYRRGVDMLSESMIFVKSRISENLKPETITSLGLTGTKFYYNEDGDPLPVEYVVTESVTAIVDDETGSCCGNKTPIELVGAEGANPALLYLDWDYKTGYNAFTELFSDSVLSITNAEPGDYGTLKIKQGVGGPYLLTLPATSYVSGNGSGVITLIAGVGEHDIAQWYMDENGAFNWTLGPQFT